MDSEYEILRIMTYPKGKALAITLSLVKLLDLHYGHQILAGQGELRIISVLIFFLIALRVYSDNEILGSGNLGGYIYLFH